MAKDFKDTDIKQIVEKMARLARLGFDPAQLDRFSDKARSVLSYVKQLDELDTSGIEPTSHAIEMESFLREDVAVSSGISDVILNAAPDRDGPFVQVPKVIDSE